MKPTFYHPDASSTPMAAAPLEIVVAVESDFARALLVRLIENTGRARVVASCATGMAAITSILSLRPDIAVLEMQMSPPSAFDILRVLDDRGPRAVVFATSFDQEAVCLLASHKASYILRPFGAGQFQRAFNRSVRTIAAGGDTELLARRALLEADVRARGIPHAARRREHVAVRSGPAVTLIRTRDVDWWETAANYLRLHVAGTSHRVRLTASAIEQQLDPTLFVRIHRKYIVNVERIAHVRPAWRRDGTVTLVDGTELRLSRTYSDNFTERVRHREAPQSVFPGRSACCAR